MTSAETKRAAQRIGHHVLPLARSHRQQPCDLCGGTEFEIVAEHDRRGAPLTTVICNQCGLLSHEQIPTEQELAEYYAHEYRQAYHGEYIPSAYRVLREWNRGRELVRLLHPYLHRADHIVEIGCGMGCTVKNFARAGFKAYGIEPGEGFRNFAVRKLHADVRPGMLHDLPATPMADVILLVHVLEHLPDPTRSLRHVHAMLKQDGRLYLEVPNAGLPHSAPGKMFHFAHIYNFTRDTLEAMAKKVGFTVQARLGSKRDRNLRLLLRRSDTAAWHWAPDSYQHTLDALTRYSTVTYHLRWHYLHERVATILRHASNRVLARRRLQRLLAEEGVGHSPNSLPRR